MAERKTLTASLVGGLENESLCKLESHPKLCGRTSDDENEGDVSIESITFCRESFPLVAVPAKGLVVPLSAKHGLVKRITFRAKFCSALFPPSELMSNFYRETLWDRHTKSWPVFCRT